MGLKRKVGGSAVVFVGFMLSPLSWWNDLFVNVPLALVFAWVISLVYKPAFAAAAVIGYLLTNVLGFVLMQKGAEQVLREKSRKYSGRDFARDAAISVLYTGLILLLIRIGVLKPLSDYFHTPPGGA